MVWFLRYLLLQIGNKVWKGVWWVLQWGEPIANAQHWGFMHTEGPEQNKRISSKNKWHNKTHCASDIDTITCV